MRVKIEYYYNKNASPEFPFWAKSDLNGEYVCSCGTSWDDAKSKQVQKLSDLLEAPTPPIAEEVDL